MPIRLGFAGFYFHVGCLLKRDDPQLEVRAVAQADHPPDSPFHNPVRNAAETAASLGLAHYDDWRAMLDAEDLDAVAVFEVDAQKADVVATALEAGKHVIVDKPLCTRLDDLDRIEAALAGSAGSLAMLVPFPQSPMMRELKAILDSGALGDVLAVQSRRAYKQKVPARPKWFFTKEHGGGILCEVATHDLDLVRFLTGRDPVAVSARAFNGKIREYPTGEDYAVALFELEGNTLYSVQVDRIPPANAQGDPSSLAIYGTKGQAVIPAGFQEVVVTVEGEDAPRTLSGLSLDGYPALVAAWLDAVESGDHGLSFFAPAVLPSVRGVLAAQQSADTGGGRQTL